MSDVRTPELVINKLSKQQYESIQNPSNTELYLVPEDEEHKPICYPTTASDVKITSMVVKSNVSDNGKILTENGFVYNTSGNPTVSDTKVICDLGVGFMEKKLENLTMNTEYHIKSYGQNASGLVYGSELVQMTLPSPIPGEYQLVEYLESSGTQYIDTGYIPNILHTIICKLSVNSGFSTANGIGCFDTTDTTIKKRCFFGGMANDEFLNIANSTSSFSSFTIQFDTQQHLYTLTPSSVSIDEYTTINVNEYPSEYFILFGYWTHRPTISINYAHIKLLYFKVIYNDIYIKRMYPVYRIADNKPGMYDIVNNVFYTNQGSGEFVVGPDKEWDE